MASARGFTMIELMIALVIAGVILMVGLPSFSRYRATLTLRQANAQLLQDVRRARQLAVTQHAPVYIRFGAPPSTTDITSYTIHVDSNGDGLVQANEMRTNRAMPSQTSLTSVNLSPVDTLAFDISGILKPGTMGGTLVFANSRNLRDTLLVSAAGICYRP